MIVAADSSVLIASLVGKDPHHEAMSVSQDRGVRGGAIYDFLHLRAARKVSASRLYTKDVIDFKSFHRPGDPEILHP